MNSDEIKCIEAKMYAEAIKIVAEEKFALDDVDSATWVQIANILGKRALFTNFWLISPCSYLGGKRPLDVLKLNPSEVIAAAVRKRNWRSPG